MLILFCKKDSLPKHIMIVLTLIALGSKPRTFSSEIFSELGDNFIIRGNVGREYVHILISCPPTISPAEIAKKLKVRSSRLLQSEYKDLSKRYWGQHMWANGYFCRTVGLVTEEIIKEYIENQRDDLDEIFKINDKQL